MDKVKHSILLSSQCFINIVWPVISAALGGGTVFPVEGNNIQAMQTLDRVSGIDAWHVMANEEGVRGIASRVQPNDKRSGWPYDSFTIRRSIVSGNETEYHKRMKAIMKPERGMLFPAVTVQAYVETFDGPVVSVGVVHTVDLYNAVSNGEWPIMTASGGSEFLTVYWSKLKSIGVRVKVIKHQAGTKETA